MNERTTWVETPGLIMPEYLARQRRRPVAVDLFCGAGGMTLGTMQAGFHVVAGCDYDVGALITYAYNLAECPLRFVFIEPSDEERMEKALIKIYKTREKEAKGGIIEPFVAGGGWRGHHPDVPGVRVIFCGDIRKLTGERLLQEIGLKRGEVDLVMGGPPCQGFSRAGKQNVMDPRNSLVFDFARLVLEIHPKTMVMENVPDIIRMVTPEGVPVVDALCRVLEDGGFGTLDGLKRSLLHTAGLGAMMRGRPKKDDAGSEAGPEGQEAAQLSLF